MMRDQLEAVSPEFERDGYTLTPVAVHNLGSHNRLITLDTSYIELLGWPPGREPARREIADQPFGLDALVFQSADAQDTYGRLREAGFDVNPVQRLERPIPYRGRSETARFDTVRFATQPVPGLRMYFCQHLTPDYVWDPQAMRHANGAQALHGIVVHAPNAGQVADVLARLTHAPLSALPDGSRVLRLCNLELRVEERADLNEARIAQATLLHRDGSLRPFTGRYVPDLS